MNGGKWITIKGTHIFIKDSETLSQAIERNKEVNENWNKTHSSKDADKKVSVKECKSEAEGKAFKNALVEAKKTQPDYKAWRVDTDSHEGKDYVGMKIYTSEGGSTFAVKKDGDIISVCTNINDSVKGYELLDMAIKAGGKKLDSFDGNFKFYMQNGFEPVSWIKFDKSPEIRPKDWKEGRDREEPVVFFKYTGKKYSTRHTKDYWELKKSNFYKKVKMSAGYKEAMETRDKEMK